MTSMEKKAEAAIESAARPTPVANHRGGALPRLGQRPGRKILKIIVFSLAALLMISALAFLWLRSSSGSAFVCRQVVKILADSGLHLSADEFQGPLPGRLFIRNLTLADAEGPLIKAGTAEVRLALLPLLGGTARIPLIKVEKPELIRLPQSADQSPEESGEFSLPVKIRLERLLVAEGLVHKNSLAALGLENGDLHFRAEGRAELIGPGSSVELLAELREDLSRELLSLNLSLAEENGLDRLKLDLSFDDGPGGLMSGLLKDPSWPGLKVEMKADGPLNDWQGRVNLAAGSMAELAADLSFKGRSGQLWPDLKARSWQAALKAEITGGQDFPAQASHWLGSRLELEAGGGLNGSAAEAVLALRGESGLSLSSDLKGELKSGGGDFLFSALLDGLKHPENFSPQRLDLKADLQLAAERQKINRLEVRANGLKIEASAERLLETEGIIAAVGLSSAENSDFVAALMSALDMWPNKFSGDIELSADLDWRGPQRAARGDIVLSAGQLSWPSAELEKILGPSIRLEAALSGGGASPLKLDLKKLQSALLALEARAEISPGEDLRLSPFKIDSLLRVADLSAVSPDLGGGLRLDLEAQGTADDLKADFRLLSAALNTPQGEFKDLALKLNLAGNLLSEEQSQLESRLAGDLDLTVADSPGGPLKLNSKWALKHRNDLLDLNIDSLEGDLAGARLSGVLTALADGTKTAAGGPPPLNLKIDGHLAMDVSRWDQLAALTGLKLSGAPASLNLKFASGEKGQSAEGHLNLPELRLSDGRTALLALKKTALDFKGDDLLGRPGLDLDLKLGGGLAGPFSWQSGLVSAKGLEGRGEVSANLEQARLSGSGGSRSDGLKLEAGYDLTGTPEIDIRRLDFSLAGGGLSLKEAARLSLGQYVSVSPFSLNFKPGGQLAAEVDLTPGAMKVKARGTKIPYRAFKAFAPETMPDGEIQNLDIDLRQSGGGLAGGFELKTQVAAKELKNIKPILTVQGELLAGASPVLDLSGKIEGGAAWKSDGAFKARLPLQPGSDGGPLQPDLNAPLSAELNFTGPIKPLWFLAGQPDRSVSGLLQLQASVGGSLSRPLPRGTLYLAGGRYEDSVLGLLVSNIKLEAHSSPELPLKALLSAEDGKKGGLALEAQVRNLDKPIISAKGRMNHFSPTHRDDVVVYISGDFGAEGPLDQLTLTSDLTVDQGELDLQIIASGSSVPTLPISNIGDGITRNAGGMRADLKVNIPGRFFIRGPGLESEWRGSINVGGRTTRPSLVGQIGPVRGYYTFAAKEFQFNGGEISFSGGATPILNLELVNKTPGLTAILRFGGTASKPTLSMESQPPLPEEEVLSHVLFGKSASAISRFEALQLASAVNDLRNFGQSGFNALGTVRSSLGLDVLRLGGSNENRQRQVSSLSGSMGQELGGASSSGPGGEQSDDISVEAGKYISDNVYVGVEHSGVGGAAVRLEVELAPSVSLEARSSTESSRVGLGWKKDY